MKKKIKMTIELTYNAGIMHNDDNDKESKDWFYNDILLKDKMLLVSREISDEIGSVKVISIESKK